MVVVPCSHAWEFASHRLWAGSDSTERHSQVSEKSIKIAWDAASASDQPGPPHLKHSLPELLCVLPLESCWSWLWCRIMSLEMRTKIQPKTSHHTSKRAWTSRRASSPVLPRRSPWRTMLKHETPTAAKKRIVTKSKATTSPSCDRQDMIVSMKTLICFIFATTLKSRKSRKDWWYICNISVRSRTNISHSIGSSPLYLSSAHWWSGLCGVGDGYADSKAKVENVPIPRYKTLQALCEEMQQ